MHPDPYSYRRPPRPADRSRGLANLALVISAVTTGVLLGLAGLVALFVAALAQL